MKQGLITLCIFAFLSCTHREKWSVTLHKSLVNETNTDLYYEVHTDKGVNSIFVNAFDSVDLMFYKEDIVESSILLSTILQDRIKIEKESLYSLTDTSKYVYSLTYEIIPKQGKTEEEKIFARHLSWELGDGSTDKNTVIIVKLNATDSIIDLMQKDYTLPEKFPEYYTR
ncbi:MAG: hypothetical protein LBT73_01820 [Tannerellaceae bacterium]|jgi:hypothetical protein|nr:hypothetical protein [Tannerellaceae bacterium]